MATTLLLILTITALFFLTSTVLLLALSHLRLMQKLEKVTHEGLGDPEGQKKLKKILNEGYEKSLKIITDAEQEAQDIIHQGNIVAKDEQAAITKALKETTAAHVAVFEELMQNWQKESKQLATQSSTQMNTTAQKQLDTFQKSLLEAMKTSQGQFEQQFEQYLTQAQKEIETFKQAQMAQVTEQSKKLVMAVAQKALQSKLTPQEHEALITSSLEHAKSQGLL